MNSGNQSPERLFEAALHLTSPAQRAAFLDGACGGDVQLRQRVEALLKDYEQAGQFLEQPPAAFSPNTLVVTTGMVAVTEKPGDKIGRYKLREQIGEGGCGVVYVAEQQEPVRRRVALKVIKLGMDTKQVVARFEAERQALALMDHPNIAKVLDAGATDTGRPYFVMELVRGIRITDYCDKNNLSTTERLKLFIPVCSAIQHAHQKGIIHRDIKPSNILVTLHDGEPVPKVIDFGIAKATSDQRLTDNTVYTAFEQFIGTPAYMSPEQAEMSSLDIDTRSDIYALGVLLYELLTGKTPFDAQRLVAAGLDEIRRIIREEDPPRPSTRISTLDAAEQTSVAKRRHAEPPKLIHLVRGDLDWIVMKCLEKDRTRRYETANGLATDLERHLKDEPVTARPPSTWYRFQKVVRRNKAAFGAATIVMLALGLGIIGSTWQAVRATRAEREKGRLYQEAERMAEESRNRLARLNTASGIRLMEADHFVDSLPYLAEAAKLSQQSSNNAKMALSRLRSALDQGPRLVQAIYVEEGVSRVEFSPDGSRLLTVAQEYYGYRGGARVWNVTSGEPTSPLLRQGQATGDACFSPDGKRVAVGGTDGITLILDASTGKPVSQPIRQSAGVQAVAFDTDGKMLLTAVASYGSGTNRYGEAQLWDAATSEPLSPLLRCSTVIDHAALSSDGQRILTVGEDETVCIWDAVTGKKTAPDLRLGGGLRYAAFSPDGNSVAVTGSDKDGNGGARVFRVTGEPTTPILEFGGEFADFSPDGRRLLLASWNSGAQVWNTLNGKPITPPLSHGVPVTKARFSPDGRLIATASDDGTARLWSAISGGSLAVLRSGDKVHDVRFSPDGTVLATVGNDHLVRIWDLTRMPPVALHHDHSVWWASFSPDGKRVATHDTQKTVRFWDAVTGVCLLTLQQHGLELRVTGDRSAFFSPGARRLLIGNTLWNIDTGKGIDLYPSVRDAVRRFSVSGKMILFANRMEVVGAEGVPALVLDAATGAPLSPPLGDGYVYETSLSPDEKLVATAGKIDGYARVWDVATGQLACPPLKHDEGAHLVCFSPDSKKLATAGGDNCVHVWSVEYGRQLTPPLRHSDMIMHLSFSPDGLLIATASWDRTARIWNASTGQAVTPPLRHPSLSVFQATFSPDGKFLLTASERARLWDAATGELVALPVGAEVDTLYWSRSSDVEFNPSGDCFLTINGRTVSLWNLEANTRSTKDLLLLAEVVSAHTMDATGAPAPLDAAILSAQFRQLRSRYAGEFAISPAHVLKWHAYEAVVSERQEDWFGMRFHLDCLLQANPGATPLRERRERAQAELDKLDR